MSDSLLTSRQVAEAFKVHPATVAKWADQGVLPYFRTPGGHRRFRREDVQRLIEQGDDTAPIAAASP